MVYTHNTCRQFFYRNFDCVCTLINIVGIVDFITTIYLQYFFFQVNSFHH